MRPHTASANPRQDISPDVPDYFTVAELIDRLRVGRSAVYNAIRAGSIPSIRVGKSIRVPASWLEVR